MDNEQELKMKLKTAVKEKKIKPYFFDREIKVLETGLNIA